MCEKTFIRLLTHRQLIFSPTNLVVPVILVELTVDIFASSANEGLVPTCIETCLFVDGATFFFHILLISATACVLAMVQLRLWVEYSKVPLLTDFETKIDIVEYDSEILIKAADGLERFTPHHLAGAGNSCAIIWITHGFHITAIFVGQHITQITNMVCGNPYSAVLHQIIGEQQFGANDAHFRTGEETDHGVKPVTIDYDRVIVQEQQYLTIAMRGTIIADCGIVETCSGPSHNLDFFILILNSIIVCKGFLLSTVVLDQSNVIILVGRLFQYRSKATLQQLRMVLRGDDNTHFRRSLIDVTISVTERQLGI